MKPELMNSDPHQGARMLIAVAGEEGHSNADKTWLAAHLKSCPSCRQFLETSRETIQSLRGISITAGTQLVSATQMRLRRRAEELQRQQERTWVIGVCIAAVSLCTAVATVPLWLGFAWVARQAHFSPPVWEGGFAIFYVMPAILAGILLLARGTHLTDHTRSLRD